MKKIFIFFLVFFIIIYFIFNIFRNNKTYKYKKLTLNNHIFWIEVADNPEKRERGLSYRPNLKKDQGMLFIFEKGDFHKFWMKGMNFPLDFLWINGDKIVDMTEYVKPMYEKGSDPVLYNSRYPVDKVLELNAGIIKETDAKIGDKIYITW